MAPKKNPKGKVKVKVVHEADLIPQSTLNKYKIDTKAFKILKESHMWNEILISKNTKDVLAGINGLTDSMSDQICEAVNKIMDSLKSEAGVFIQNTVTMLEKSWHDTEHDKLKLFFRKVQECAGDFYSGEEMLDRLAVEFGQEVTKRTYEFFFSSKMGRRAYLQMSSIRAAQRKAEQKKVGEEEKNEELSVKKDEIALENENLAEEKEKQAAQSRRPLALSQQVNTLSDAFESQQKLYDEVISHQPAIAPKEDLKSFGIGISTKIDSLVKELGIEVGAGIEDILSAPPSSNTLEQTVRSELKGALSVLETKFKERIQSAVTSTIQKRISASFLQRDYDACFTIAVGADDTTLGWLLSLLNQELVSGMQQLPLANETFLALLLRLTDLVFAEEGEHTDAFCTWFQAIRRHFSPPFPVLKIPEEMMPRVRAADAHVFRTYHLA